MCHDWCAVDHQLLTGGLWWLEHFLTPKNVHILKREDQYKRDKRPVPTFWGESCAHSHRRKALLAENNIWRWPTRFWHNYIVKLYGLWELPNSTPRSSPKIHEGFDRPSNIYFCKMFQSVGREIPRWVSHINNAKQCFLSWVLQSFLGMRNVLENQYKCFTWEDGRNDAILQRN